MGLFNRFPYTNFHELNLDWIIEKVKEVIVKSDNATTISEEAISTARTASGKSDNAVQVSSEANNKSTESITKSLQALSKSEEALNTANGIDAKATQALSNSESALNTANGIDAKATQALSNSESAVNTANGIDAKATQALSNSESAVNTANEKYGGTFTGDLNNLHTSGNYFCNFANVSNSPYGSGNYGWLEVFGSLPNDERCVQRITLYSGATSGTLKIDISYRFFLNSKWFPWRQLLLDSNINPSSSDMSSGEPGEMTSVPGEETGEMTSVPGNEPGEMTSVPGNEPGEDAGEM